MEDGWRVNHKKGGPTRGRRRGRPSTREADSLEQEVLDAALAEFRANGYSGASVERIAAAAGVTRSAIYRRYTNRQMLFETVIRGQITKLREQGTRALNLSDDPLKRLREVSLQYCRYLLSSLAIDLQRIAVWESARGEALLIPAAPAELTDQLDELIAAAQVAGRLDPAPPALWRDALLGLVAEGPRWEALATNESWTDERLIERFDRMWSVFLAAATRTVGDSDA